MVLVLMCGKVIPSHDDPPQFTEQASLKGFCKVVENYLHVYVLHISVVKSFLSFSLMDFVAYCVYKLYEHCMHMHMYGECATMTRPKYIPNK